MPKYQKKTDEVARPTVDDVVDATEKRIQELERQLEEAKAKLDKAEKEAGDNKSKAEKADKAEKAKKEAETKLSQAEKAKADAEKAAEKAVSVAEKARADAEKARKDLDEVKADAEKAKRETEIKVSAYEGRIKTLEQQLAEAKAGIPVANGAERVRSANLTPAEEAECKQLVGDISVMWDRLEAILTGREEENQRFNAVLDRLVSK